MSPVPRRSGARPLVAGHAPKQRLSQSFLVDLEARDAIVAAGGAAPGEIVLEIGPGLGVLTEGLLAAGARVVAIELDDDLLPRLQEKFAKAIASGDLTLIHGDALNVDLEPLLPSDGVWRVVANIPYHITSPLLHRLLLLEHPANESSCSSSVRSRSALPHRLATGRISPRLSDLGARPRLCAWSVVNRLSQFLQWIRLCSLLSA